jgi:hypothetical protein
MRACGLEELKRQTARILTVLAAVLAAGAAATPASLAQSPAVPRSESARSALAWEHPEAEAARSWVEALDAGLTPWGQLDYSARIRPLVRYQEYPGDGDVGDLTTRLGVSASLTFGDRPATYARALQTLERARQDLFLLGSRGVRDALLAHAELLIALEAEARAGREAAEADAALTELEQAAEQPATSAEQRAAPSAEEPSLRAARLEQRQAALALRRAEQDRAEAEAAAAAYGFASTVRYEPLRFLLPDPAAPGQGPRATHDYRMLELELLEAEAELSEVKGHPLDDLRIRAAYRTRSTEVDIQGGIVNGRPGLGFGLSSPGGLERWQLELSAELMLDDAWLGLPRLEAAVDAAGEELELFPSAFRASLAHSLGAAELADEALALAEEDAALAEEALTTRRSELAEVERGGAGGRTLERSRQALARAERNLSASRVRLYRAWIAYISAVAKALEMSGGTWQL